MIASYNGNLVPAEEWYQKATRGTLAPCDTCLSFDDSLLCQYDIALPVLDHYRLTAFWFVYTSVYTGGAEMLEVYRRFRHQCFDGIDGFYSEFFRVVQATPFAADVDSALRSLDERQFLPDYPYYSPGDKRFRFVRDYVLGRQAYGDIMAEMMKNHGFDFEACGSSLWLREEHLRHLHSCNHIVGLHSHTHPTVMASLSQEEQEAEYVTNFSTLHDITGVAPLTMSHPCNSYSQETLTVLRRLGIQIGFCATMATLAMASELEFPREDSANIASWSQ